MSSKNTTKLPRHLTKLERKYVELGIWEEKTLRKLDGKTIETCYFVEVSERNLPGKSPTRPTKIGRAPNLVEARRLRDQLRTSLREEIHGTPKVTLAEYFSQTWYPDI